MTAQIIRSRRSEAQLSTAFGLLLSIICMLGGAVLGHAATPPWPKLPVIQNVGIIPVQWEGDPGTPKEVIDHGFPSIVRESHKFRILNDDLVSDLWQDADGRAELRSQYELQSFIGLTMTSRGDVVTMTARLTDQGLKTQLLETDTVSRDWLANAPPEEALGRLEALVFRLLNRLPVDVNVTSIQGKYLTLSGGTEQNIEVGDRVDLVRTSIRSLQPANGTWLEFKKQPLGTAQIVEVKTYNSVAKILTQTYDHAIEIGDGARIGALAARVKFARLAVNEGLKDSGNQETIIVAPLYHGEPPQPKPAAQVAAPAPAPAPVPMTDPSAKAPDAAATEKPSTEAAPPATPPPATAENTPPAAAPAAESTGSSFLDEIASDATSHKLLDEVSAYAGPYWWSVGGSKLPGTSGKFPFYLLNSAGVGVTHTLLFKFKTAFGGGVIFGKTTKGSYVGYQGYGRIYWEEALILFDGAIRGWRAGGFGSLSGMSVDQESYGGGDWIRGGGFAGLFGKFSTPDLERYDWNAEFSLLPLTIGRAGFAGNRQQTQSTFGYGISLSAYQDRPARLIAWGAGFDLSSEVQTLDDGRRPQYQAYQIKALARIGL